MRQLMWLLLLLSAVLSSSVNSQAPIVQWIQEEIFHDIDYNESFHYNGCTVLVRKDGRGVCLWTTINYRGTPLAEEKCLLRDIEGDTVRVDSFARGEDVLKGRSISFTPIIDVFYVHCAKAVHYLPLRVRRQFFGWFGING